MFLEEAAGVSKYKERRRETENRLKDTRENLTRVDDILRELNANLDKLEKQAEVAAPATARCRTKARSKLHQLWFLKHRDAANEEERVKKAVADAGTALEARMAELRHVEAELETVRQAHYAGQRRACTPRRACWPRPRSKSAGSKSASATSSRAASAPSSACTS